MGQAWGATVKQHICRSYNTKINCIVMKSKLNLNCAINVCVYHILFVLFVIVLQFLCHVIICTFPFFLSSTPCTISNLLCDFIMCWSIIPTIFGVSAIYHVILLWCDGQLYQPYLEVRHLFPLVLYMTIVPNDPLV